MNNISKELIINVTSKEILIALLKNKRLEELYREKNNLRFSVGDIHIGKVKKIMPGLNAAFVDVGYEKDAFLHYLDLGQNVLSLHKYFNKTIKEKKYTNTSDFKLEPGIEKTGKISEVLKSGQNILVQIAKEPISTKGPRLSSELSIAGRNLVLIPFANKVSISQKIKSFEEKNRLKKLIGSIKPENFGVIIRTVAEGKKVAELDQELRGLIEKWETAFKFITKNELTPPKLFLGEIDRTVVILRDILNDSFTSINVNDNVIYSEIKDYVKSVIPEKEKIVKLYSGQNPIFDNFNVEKQIKGLFGKTVMLKSGAYLIIEHTEALHVIDVNSGNLSKSGKDQEDTALEVNLISAKEIARQLKLRDMGGIIVVDFIDMGDKENRLLLYNEMKKFMSTDYAKHNILQLSKFGLMQITRQRVRPETNISTVESCPTCNGSGEISSTILFIDEIKNHIKYLCENTNNKTIVINTHPYIAAYLTKGFFKSLRKEWQKLFKKKIKVTSSFSNNFLEYHFFNEKNEEIFI